VEVWRARELGIRDMLGAGLYTLLLVVANMPRVRVEARGGELATFLSRVSFVLEGRLGSDGRTSSEPQLV